MRAIVLGVVALTALAGQAVAAMPGGMPLPPAVVVSGAPPNSQSPAAVVWLTPRGTVVTPGLTSIFPEFLGLSAGTLPTDVSTGVTSPGIVVSGFPVH